MARRTPLNKPQARTEGLLVEEIGAERVIYDAESKQAHCLSPLASAVFASADGKAGVDDLAEVAAFAIGEPVSTEQVEAALVQLEERGLLVSTLRTWGGGMSRRAMIQRTAGATAAVTALPLVTSVVTPAFAQATPNLGCPGAICASQSAGDDFCACANQCPESTNQSIRAGDREKCAKTGPPIGPYLDSCECLNCAELTAIGKANLCPPTPYQRCPPGSSPTNPGPGGCHDASKFLDGRCFKVGGDSSEPCPTVS